MLIQMFLIMSVTLAMLSCSSHVERESPFLYKITTPQLWQNSQGKQFLELSSTDEAFIHFAEGDDVGRIARKFFRDETSVIVLKIDKGKLQGRLVKEKNPGGTKDYYHLYGGKIPMDAVIEAKILEM